MPSGASRLTPAVVVPPPTSARRQRRLPNSLRGYGAAHQRLRRIVGRQVALGGVRCVRCGELIEPGQDWHLDHSDDRSEYLGAAHAGCNLSAGGRKGNEARRRVSSRAWW